MGISVADNFSYLGGKPLDGRIQYATLTDMKNMADATLYEGCEAYCVATDKYYKWKSSNTVDASTGKWREVESGGGSGLPSGGTQGQYLVKQSSTEGDADWQTLSAFGGATASVAGSAGLVPAPTAGNQEKFLKADGTWDTPAGDTSLMLYDEREIAHPIGQYISPTGEQKTVYRKLMTGTPTEEAITGGTPFCHYSTWSDARSNPANAVTNNGGQYWLPVSNASASEGYVGLQGVDSFVFKRATIMLLEIGRNITDLTSMVIQGSADGITWINISNVIPKTEWVINQQVEFNGISDQSFTNVRVYFNGPTAKDWGSGNCVIVGSNSFKIYGGTLPYSKILHASKTYDETYNIYDYIM